ncbi:maleylpyruvate isomerase family mycothiol-dependent enzyme [Lentzea sp.]|uniref:maleylpyruvate isomerase family mycothiol-dependent enzyme n=1 Tax=Lentzea sp. TaxID=56099 RepID=UPI002C7602BF|nr:maleylpyruvate isomerase family mycothiol-dependent enzyme [Lentzea sp.]HUQ61524.1 maleylpyruvate isomerase family mycothiol-dependent enzyme [Lentzea sp.]
MINYASALRAHTFALREAVTDIGPAMPVTTCPGWTVHELTEHIALGHGMALAGLRGDAEIRWPPSPWNDLLIWWNAQSEALIEHIAADDPERTCTTLPGAPQTVGFWQRRIAHETAMHHFDAVVAAHRVIDGLWDAEFAEDGIDEMLTVLVTSLRPPEQRTPVLLAVRDTMIRWSGDDIELETRSDQQPDATLDGSADAIYRALWGRPSDAVWTGDTNLFTQITVGPVSGAALPAR